MMRIYQCFASARSAYAAHVQRRERGRCEPSNAFAPQRGFGSRPGTDVEYRRPVDVKADITLNGGYSTY